MSQMNIEIGLLLTVTGLICTGIGLLTGFFTFRLRRDQDLKREAGNSAVIENKLDNIHHLVDGMIIDLKENQKSWNEIRVFVTRLDEKLNHADKQIEIIKKEREE